METKPKLKLTLSPIDKILDGMSTVLLIVMLVLAVYVTFNAPSVIPVHFNELGHPDKFGKRFTIFILPLIGTVIYAVFNQIVKFPEIYNHLTKITGENARQQYTITTRIIRFLKLSMLLIFIVIIFFTYLTSIGKSKGLGAWFLPFVLGLTLIPTMLLIGHSVKGEKT